MNRGIGLIFFWILCFAELWGQSGITAALKFDSTHLLIGDQISCSIIITAPKGQNVYFPSVAEFWSLKNLEILGSTDVVTTPREDGKQVIEQRIALTFWDTGSYQLPPLPFTYSTAKGADTIYAAAPKIEVQYPAGITGDSTYLAPIKPILEESASWLDYLNDALPILLGLLGIGILALLVYWFMRMKKAAEERRNRLTPEGKALKHLEELEAANLPAQHKFGEYHTAISLIVRVYLQERFHIQTLDKPSSEILLIVTSNMLDNTLKKDLKEVLETADLVKFAKASPLPAANIFATDYIRRLVNTTLARMKAEAEASKEKK